MVTIRYGDIHREPAVATVTGMSQMPGPPGGDGWQVAARLPQSSLPAGTGRYAILVTFRVQNVQVLGAVPLHGVIQVCLGTTAGTISSNHEVRIAAREALPLIEGIPLQIAMVMNVAPSISDPTFGASWNNASGFEFCLYARTFWNGDPLAYSVTFEVADVTWLWWDTDRIPAADILCERYAPASPPALTLSPVALYQNINSPGSSGQKWLHFVNIVYRPLVAGAVQFAPSFQFGYVGGGGSFTPKVGSNGRWGQARGQSSASAANVRLHQGAFWYGVQPSGTFLPAVLGNDRMGALPQTIIERYTYVGIRLDNLLDVLARTDVVVANATGNLTGTPIWSEKYVAMERPGTGIISAPCVMAHGIAQTSGRQAYGMILDTDLGQGLSYLNGCDQGDGGRLEGVSTMAFSALGLAAGQPDLQYRAHFSGSFTAPPLALDVRDVSIVAFNLVRDPDVTPVFPIVPAPVVLVPGKESADAAQLNPLPFAPNAAMSEDAALDFARIDGATGYARTWPLFAKVRRTFSLTWNPISEANATTLLAFLVANVAFRLTPPRGAAIAVVALEQPEMAQNPSGGPTYSVSLRVAELIYTGA